MILFKVYEEFFPKQQAEYAKQYIARDFAKKIKKKKKT